MADKKFRIEKDSMGELKVPADKKWGAQTQRAVENFQISGYMMPEQYIKALALLKWSLASANSELDLLPSEKADAIKDIALKISEGEFADQFPVEVFQSGSATSTNMNMNEVIANLGSSDNLKIHPNDDVNLGQSSNDVIPSSLSICVAIYLHEHMIPAAVHLEKTINDKASKLTSVVKMGRTHLQDAMPITMAQELGGWSASIRDSLNQFENALEQIQELAIGGTAVGTGVNTHPDVGSRACELMNKKKIANDLRWMGSGPLGGLGEITLPALQPGSSIMPGKVNPVIPESVCMVAAQVFGHDATVSRAAQSGNFQLNLMLSIIAYDLIESMKLLTNSCYALADKAIKGFEVNLDNINEVLGKNPILVTALNSKIGYEAGAKIVKRSYQEKRSIIDVALEETDLDEKTLKDILDPLKLTQNQ